MRRLLITLIALVGIASLAEAQIIRPAGVVKKTKVKIEREPIGHWDHELGKFTQSASVLIGTDWKETIIGVDYNIQYRISPLFSAGVGIWGGFWSAYDDMYGVEIRANIKTHPLVNINPQSPYQPFAALWVGYIIPTDHYVDNYREVGDKPWIFTIESGCDIYKGKNPFYISVNLNVHTYYPDYEPYNDYGDWEEIVWGLYLKGGIKF